MNFVPMPVESWLNYGMISKTSEEQGRAVRKKIMMFISVLLFLQPSLSLAVEMPAPGEKMAQARLVSDSDGVAPGRPLQLGILLSHRQGWHTYWENPGDAGLPTSVTWALPEGFSAGEMRWPVPSRLKEGDLVVYGYSGELFLAATVAVPPALDREEYRFHALVSYLICNDICVPEEYSLDLVLPAVESARPSADAPQFAAAAAAQPKTLAQAAQFSFSGDSVRLSLPQAALDGADSAPASGEFFPRQPSLINNGASQQLAVGNGAVTLTLKKSEDRFEEPQAGGILVLNSPGRSGAYDIHFDIGMKLPPLNAFGMAGEAAPPEAPFLPALLLLAMLGGLVLNLMPCVLPVLSLKALTLVHKAGSTHSHSRMLGVAYTLGILVSFAALAGLLIGLQQAGEAVGWGYQMQSPAFVGFLVYLLFLVGLNLSGIFELPVLLGDVGQELTRASSPKGSFFTGMLATAVATPCTAPFMASAVGVALTLPAWQALLVFLSLGFGLALPFLLISFFPRLLRFLPKPGAWMNTFKHVLAWPMYASVAWLLWVLSLQTGMGGLAVALAGMALIILIIGMKRRFANPTLYHAVGIGLFFLMLAISLPALENLRQPGAMMAVGHEEGGVETHPYSPGVITGLMQQGKGIFLDATAAWCITCQVNARTAIHTETTLRLFRDRNIALVIADWTLRDDDITALLKAHGYQGVPLYIYYPPGDGVAKILPQILTESIIRDAVGP